MPPSLDLCHALDPVGFARERLRFQPDPVQARILASRSKQVILNCTRQWGKSTLTAAQAVFTAWHEPESLILVMSPTARQSAELVRKARAFLSRLGVRPRGDGGNKISLLLPNGSRIVGLPGTEATDRGFSGVGSFSSMKPLVSIRIFYLAMLPVLAVSGGDVWLISTPFGWRGFFYRTWVVGGAKLASRQSSRHPVPAHPPRETSSGIAKTMSNPRSNLFPEELVRKVIKYDIQPLCFIGVHLRSSAA